MMYGGAILIIGKSVMGFIVTQHNKDVKLNALGEKGECKNHRPSINC